MRDPQSAKFIVSDKSYNIKNINFNKKRLFELTTQLNNFQFLSEFTSQKLKYPKIR